MSWWGGLKGPNAETESFSTRLGNATFYLIIAAATAYGVLYLMKWTPTPRQSGAIAPQTEIFQLLAITPIRLGIGAVLAFMTWLGASAAWGELFTPSRKARSHGEAEVASVDDLKRARLLPRKGVSIYAGSFLDGGRSVGPVGYNGSIHMITIGPNGSGKGMGLIVPNLAEQRRSILIIDPKGEAAAITARKRAEFGTVKIINPFNVLADQRPHLRSTGFNPLAALDPDDDNFADDCAGIGQALVKEPPGSDGAFFGGSAQDLVTALVMHEKLLNRDSASLANVRRMLTERFGGDERSGPLGLARTIYEMSESPYEPLRAKAGRFMSGSRSSMDIISTAINETRFLDSPPIQRDLSGADIDWNLAKNEIVTVYLILPADRLETHANFLRLVVTSALRSLLRSPPGKKLPPVLFMLDEFAQLGYLPPIENAMGIARGFGVQLWPFIQDLNQIKALYKDRWQTFIGARGMLTAFAPQDMFTADYLSKLCGQKTEIVKSGSENRDGKGGRQGSISYAPQGFPLFRPEKLMAMPPGQMLCFVDPVKNPFFTFAPGYWRMNFKRGLDDNPYYQR